MAQAGVQVLAAGATTPGAELFHEQRIALRTLRDRLRQRRQRGGPQELRRQRARIRPRERLQGDDLPRQRGQRCVGGTLCHQEQHGTPRERFREVRQQAARRRIQPLGVLKDEEPGCLSRQRREQALASDEKARLRPVGNAAFKALPRVAVAGDMLAFTRQLPERGFRRGRGGSARLLAEPLKQPRLSGCRHGARPSDRRRIEGQIQQLQQGDGNLARLAMLLGQPGLKTAGRLFLPQLRRHVRQKAQQADPGSVGGRGGVGSASAEVHSDASRTRFSRERVGEMALPHARAADHGQQAAVSAQRLVEGRPRARQRLIPPHERAAQRQAVQQGIAAQLLDGGDGNRLALALEL